MSKEYNEQRSKAEQLQKENRDLKSLMIWMQERIDNLKDTIRLMGKVEFDVNTKGE